MCADLFIAFDNWLNQHGNALAIPLRIIERDQDMIRLKLVGITDAEVIVVRNEIMVAVLDHGTLLGHFDVDRLQTEGVCRGRILPAGATRRNARSFRPMRRCSPITCSRRWLNG